MMKDGGNVLICPPKSKTLATGLMFLINSEPATKFYSLVLDLLFPVPLKIVRMSCRGKLLPIKLVEGRGGGWGGEKGLLISVSKNP